MPRIFHRVSQKRFWDSGSQYTGSGKTLIWMYHAYLVSCMQSGFVM